MGQDGCRGWWPAGAAIAVLACSVAAFGQSWTTAQLLNDSSLSGYDVKSARVAASRNGGFHATYTVYGPGASIYYRRYNNGLGPQKLITSQMPFNPDIAEAPNGHVHIVWENWGDGAPEVGWVRSTDGGNTLSSMVNISSSGRNAKWPQIAGFGLGNSDDALMSYWNALTKEIRSNFYNGSSWSGDLGLNVYGNSQYEVTGMDRSPKDGSVYRTYDNGPWLGMQRYDGSWGSFIGVDNTGFSPRITCAVNDAGQVMVLWDADNKFWSIVYTPGSGLGPKMLVTSEGSWGTSLCAIPGTNDFYTAYAKNSGQGRLYGKRFSGGGWLPEEQISSGLGDAFTVGPDVSADPNGSGTLYCVWEWWGNGKPQQYYAVKPGTLGDGGYISGTVKDQYNAGVSGAIITIPAKGSTVSGSGGAYTLRVSPGTYSVQCSKNNYTGQTVNNVSVVKDQTTTINFTITASTPNPVSNLASRGYDGRVRLTWTNSGEGNHTLTRVLRKTGSYPTSPNDGTLVGEIPSTESSCVDSGLTNGATYYYAAYACFADASRHYSSRVTVTGVPVAAPKISKLTNGSMDTFSSGVATGWTAYKVYDPNNGLSFATDGQNVMTNPAQAINGLDHYSMPASGLTSAGLYQTVTGLTPGKVYQFVGYQDIYTSDYGADGQRYVLNFGINPSGGTSIGTQRFDGTIDGVKWMTADQALYNNAAGSPVRFGSYHRSWAAFSAASSTITVWTGLTINNAGVKDNVPAKFNTDLFWLFEWDVPANSGLQNGNFEGPVVDLQNVDPWYGGGDVIPQSWVPAGGSCGQWSALLCEADGARSGARGVRVANRRGTINGGLLQRIACTNGYYQTFTAYAKTSGQDGTVGAIGIDPAGGTDITSPNIYWTTTSAADWTQISVNATAQGSAITVFLRSSNTAAGGTGAYHYTYFDDCAWSQQPTAPTPGWIQGTVVDSCGTPVSGATVTTNPTGYSTQTAGDGTYRISGVTPGTYTVTASRSGYTNVQQTGVVVNSGQGTTVNLTFTNSKGQIAGVVTDACGIPIAGATVSTSSGGYSAQTGADGAYLIPLVNAGTYNVTASKSGFFTQTASNRTVTACATTTVDFQLPTAVEEQVVANGNMEGGTITFWGGTMPQNWGAAWRGTFASGTWSVVNIGGSQGKVLQLSGLASGFEMGVIQRVTGLTPGARYTFSAQAYQFDQGTNVWIAADPNGGTELPQRQTSFENVTGRWNTSSVTGTVGAGGSVSVFVWAYRQWGAGADVRIDNASLIVEGVGAVTGTITGTVRSSGGTPIAGARVQATPGSYSATTGADGTYVITSVAVGTYEVSATATNYNGQTVSGVSVAGCQTRTVNFNLQPVSGSNERLVNGNMEGGFWATGWGGGSAIPNGWDGWYNPGDFNCFDETGIRRGGAHSARTTISAGGDAGSGGYKRTIHQNVNVGPYASFTITVWARHTNGNCPSIMCWNPDGDANPQNAAAAGRYKWVTTDNWGQLNTWVSNTLSGTAPASGIITVMVGGAHHGGGGAGTVYIDDCSVTAQTGATVGIINGYVRDSANNPISGATVSTSSGGYSATTNASGFYQMSNVASGAYTVTASKAGYNSQSQQGVTVVAGGTTTVNFSLATASGEKMVNGNMEGGFWATGWGGGSAIPNGWQGWYNPGDFNCFDETGIRRGGAHSARTVLSVGGDAGSGGYKRTIHQNIYVGPYANFTITVWARHTNGNCPSIMCWNPDGDANPQNAAAAGRYKWVTTDNWGQLNTWVSNTLSGTAPASGNITVMVGGAHHGGGGAGTVYIDDCSVTVP